MLLPLSMLLLAPRCCRCFYTLDGPTLIGLHFHGLVHAVAGTYDVAGVSVVLTPTVAGVLAS
jgi:hypothetical protein